MVTGFYAFFHAHARSVIFSKMVPELTKGLTKR